MKLEQQLAKLAEIGLKLNDGVTVDDLIYSFDRSEYEEAPFDLILTVFGFDIESEPEERSICSRVWNFDMECIEATGDYTRIVKRLCKVADKPDCLEAVSDFFDLDAGEGWLRYKVTGIQRDWPLEVNEDWADTMTLSYVMDDIQSGNCYFFARDNGQAMVLFYLSSEAAAQINILSNNSLTLVLC